MKEYSDTCNCCYHTSVDKMFARIWFKKLNGKWVHLCKKCWEQNSK